MGAILLILGAIGAAVAAAVFATRDSRDARAASSALPEPSSSIAPGRTPTPRGDVARAEQLGAIRRRIARDQPVAQRAQPRYYVIKKRARLADVAARAGTSLAAVQTLNPSLDASTVYPAGSRVRIS